MRKMAGILGCPIRTLNHQLTWKKTDERKMRRFILYDVIEGKMVFRGTADEMASYINTKKTSVYNYSLKLIKGKSRFVYKDKYIIFKEGEVDENRIEEVKTEVRRKMAKKRKIKVRKMSVLDFEMDLCFSKSRNIEELADYLVMIMIHITSLIQTRMCQSSI